jgi:hypothetical protein
MIEQFQPIKYSLETNSSTNIIEPHHLSLEHVQLTIRNGYENLTKNYCSHKIRRNSEGAELDLKLYRVYICGNIHDLRVTIEMTDPKTRTEKLFL